MSVSNTPLKDERAWFGEESGVQSSMCTMLASDPAGPAGPARCNQLCYLG